MDSFLREPPLLSVHVVNKLKQHTLQKHRSNRLTRKGEDSSLFCAFLLWLLWLSSWPPCHWLAVSLAPWVLLHPATLKDWQSGPLIQPQASLGFGTLSFCVPVLFRLLGQDVLLSPSPPSLAPVLMYKHWGTFLWK